MSISLRNTLPTLLLFACAVMLALGLNTAKAQTADSKMMVNKSDRMFFEKAAASGMFEVKAGEVAASKASNMEVKALGEMMVRDHDEANDKLMALAKSKGVSLPTTLDKEHADMLMKLQQGPAGMAFDEMYIEQMDKGHKKTIALFEDAGKSTDADIASFAKMTLPTLKHHHEMVMRLEKMMDSTAKSR